MLQAKCGFPSSSDPLQRILYEEAEEFEYRRSGKDLNGKRRHFASKSDLELAYWDPDAGGLVPWWHYPTFASATSSIWAADARQDLDSRGGFGGIFVDLVFGLAGEGFTKARISDTGWSRIIHDLLTTTAAKALKKPRIANLRGLPRGRLADAIIAAHDQQGPLLVRNSLGEVLSFLDDGLVEPAVVIEEKSISLTNPIFGDYAKQVAGSGDNSIPPLKQNEEEDPDGNACNILFLHCDRANEEVSRRRLRRQIEE